MIQVKRLKIKIQYLVGSYFKILQWNKTNILIFMFSFIEKTISVNKNKDKDLF